MRKKKKSRDFFGARARASMMPEVVEETQDQSAAALQELLDVEGLSQADACRIGGIDAGQLSGLLRGSQSPNINTLAAIAATLGYRLIIKYERRQ